MGLKAILISILSAGLKNQYFVYIYFDSNILALYSKSCKEAFNNFFCLTKTIGNWTKWESCVLNLPKMWLDISLTNPGTFNCN